ncbi:unnamed protein product [Jaminaea pallidilutea]
MADMATSPASTPSPSSSPPQSPSRANSQHALMSTAASTSNPLAQQQPLASSSASTSAPRSARAPSTSRPLTDTTSRSDEIDGIGAAAENPPPSPSSASLSEGDQDVADEFAPDLRSSSAFALAERRRTIRAQSRDAVGRGSHGYSRGRMDSEEPTSPAAMEIDRSSSSIGRHRDGTITQSSSSSAAIGNTSRSSPANLPHEILLHIFRFILTRTTGHAHLQNCLLVCRSWCLCGVELLWHRPAFNNLSSLFRLIGIIRRPEETTFPYANFVRRLNFGGIAPDLSDQLFGFMASCTRLERLAIGDCTQLTDEGVSGVLCHLKNLVSIDLTNLKNIEDQSVLAIANNCKRLQGINLTNCSRITSKSVAEMGNNCPLLRRVKLAGCQLVDDDGILPMILHCPMLLEIDVYNCPLVSDRSVRQIWLSTSHARELRLANVGPLTDVAFPAPERMVTSSTAALDLGAGGSRHLLHHYEHLNTSTGPHGSESAPTSRGASPVGGLGRPRGEDVGSDAAHNGHVRTITGALSSSMSLTAPMRPPKAFEHLRVLDLTNCSTISDAAIEGIISCAPRIRNLFLSKCTRLTDETVFSIAKLKKNLQYLHLGHVSNITDRSVCHLVNHCTRLRYFDLACCSQLTDLSVTELAAKLPKLKRIGLVRVTQLTDRSLYALVERHLSLQRIHLSYCEHISVAAVFWLLERLPKVTHISLTGVPAFRRRELQAMCRSPPEDFSEHQRQAFCVYSGSGVVELQQYLRQKYSSEDSASELGDITPEVKRAVQLVRETNERKRAEQRRLLHYSRHPAGGAIAVGQGQPGRTPQTVVWPPDTMRVTVAGTPGSAQYRQGNDVPPASNSAFWGSERPSRSSTTALNSAEYEQWNRHAGRSAASAWSCGLGAAGASGTGVPQHPSPDPWLWNPAGMPVSHNALPPSHNPHYDAGLSAPSSSRDASLSTQTWHDANAEAQQRGAPPPESLRWSMPLQPSSLPSTIATSSPHWSSVRLSDVDLASYQPAFSQERATAHPMASSNAQQHQQQQQQRTQGDNPPENSASTFSSATAAGPSPALYEPIQSRRGASPALGHRPSTASSAAPQAGSSSSSGGIDDPLSKLRMFRPESWAHWAPSSRAEVAARLSALALPSIPASFVQRSRPSGDRNGTGKSSGADGRGGSRNAEGSGAGVVEQGDRLQFQHTTSHEHPVSSSFLPQTQVAPMHPEVASASSAYGHPETTAPPDSFDSTAASMQALETPPASTAEYEMLPHTVHNSNPAPQSRTLSSMPPSLPTISNQGVHASVVGSASRPVAPRLGTNSAAPTVETMPVDADSPAVISARHGIDATEYEMVDNDEHGLEHEEAAASSMRANAGGIPAPLVQRSVRQRNHHADDDIDDDEDRGGGGGGGGGGIDEEDEGDVYADAEMVLSH